MEYNVMEYNVMVEKTTIGWDAMVLQLLGDGNLVGVVIKAIMEPMVVGSRQHKATDSAV
jgi:hypothetical protein